VLLLPSRACVNPPALDGGDYTTSNKLQVRNQELSIDPGKHCSLPIASSWSHQTTIQRLSAGPHPEYLA
jgi:hypothetical protein